MQDNKSCPCAELLLVNDSDETVKVLYTPNSRPFELPLIAIRPPFYCNPVCEAYYPII